MTNFQFIVVMAVIAIIAFVPMLLDCWKQQVKLSSVKQEILNGV